MHPASTNNNVWRLLKYYGGELDVIFLPCSLNSFRRIWVKLLVADEVMVGGFDASVLRSSQAIRIFSIGDDVNDLCRGKLVGATSVNECLQVRAAAGDENEDSGSLHGI